jgi:hypothetical protein
MIQAKPPGRLVSQGRAHKHRAHSRRETTDEPSPSSPAPRSPARTMPARKNGRTEERKNGRTEERKNGRTEEKNHTRHPLHPRFINFRYWPPPLPLPFVTYHVAAGTSSKKARPRTFFSALSRPRPGRVRAHVGYRCQAESDTRRTWSGPALAERVGTQWRALPGYVLIPVLLECGLSETARPRRGRTPHATGQSTDPCRPTPLTLR